MTSAGGTFESSPSFDLFEPLHSTPFLLRPEPAPFVKERRSRYSATRLSRHRKSYHYSSPAARSKLIFDSCRILIILHITYITPNIWQSTHLLLMIEIEKVIIMPNVSFEKTHKLGSVLGPRTLAQGPWGRWIWNCLCYFVFIITIP